MCTRKFREKTVKCGKRIKKFESWQVSQLNGGLLSWFFSVVSWRIRYQVLWLIHNAHNLDFSPQTRTLYSQLHWCPIRLVLFWVITHHFGFFTSDDGRDILPRNVGKKLPYSLRNNSGGRSTHQLRGGPEITRGNRLIFHAVLATNLAITLSWEELFYPCWRHPVSYFITHRIITVSTSRSSLKQWPLIQCLSAGTRRKYFGDILPWHITICVGAVFTRLYATKTLLRPLCRMQVYCLEIFHNITFPDTSNLWIWYTTIRLWWTYPTTEAAFS